MAWWGRAVRLLTHVALVVSSYLLLAACRGGGFQGHAAPTPHVVASAPPATVRGNAGTDDAATTPVNSLATIIDDMAQPHAAAPHGVPASYDWAATPQVHLGNQPGTFRALMGWGQLYEAASGNPATNSRVQLRQFATYVLSKRTNQWQRVQQGGITGAAFREDYQGNANTAADVRHESPDALSATAGDGYNYHFWFTAGRATIEPDDIAGVWVTVQARLVLADDQQPDDRAQARYLVSVGGDYWRDQSAQWDNFQSSGGIGVGRFKYVTADWQAFNMTTVSAETLRHTPPPLDE